MPKEDLDWRDHIQKIADGWVFSDITATFPKRVIIPFENPDLFKWQSFIGHLDNAEIFKGIAIGNFRGTQVGILKSKFGSAAVSFISHLLANRGVEKIIGIGYCGGLHPDYQSGQVIASKSVSRIACTSRRYLHVQSDIEASPSLIKLAVETACKNDIPLICARTVSTDDILLETSMQVQSFYQSGLFAIDMECGSLYALGKYFNMETLALLVVSDNPLSKCAAEYDKVGLGMTSAIQLGLIALTDSK